MPPFCSEASSGFPDLTKSRSQSPFHDFKTVPDLGLVILCRRLLLCYLQFTLHQLRKPLACSFNKENISGPLRVLFPLIGTFFPQNLYKVLLTSLSLCSNVTLLRGFSYTNNRAHLQHSLALTLLHFLPYHPLTCHIYLFVYLLLPLNRV